MLTATATAQALHHVQVALYTPRTGLHAAALSRRRTPDGFSAELHRDLGMWLLRAVFDEWHLQSLLPTEARQRRRAEPAGRGLNPDAN